MFDSSIRKTNIHSVALSFPLQFGCASSVSIFTTVLLRCLTSYPHFLSLFASIEEHVQTYKTNSHGERRFSYSQHVIEVCARSTVYYRFVSIRIDRIKTNRRSCSIHRSEFSTSEDSEVKKLKKYRVGTLFKLGYRLNTDFTTLDYQLYTFCMYTHTHLLFYSKVCQFSSDRFDRE